MPEITFGDMDQRDRFDYMDGQCEYCGAPLQHVKDRKYLCPNCGSEYYKCEDCGEILFEVNDVYYCLECKRVVSV